MRGECNCGAVSFEIRSDVSDVYLCHCSICRRATGSNGIAVLLVENCDFEWLSGQNLIRCWHKPKHEWQNYFCSRCGSPLPGEIDDQNIYVPAGLIVQGGEQLKVAAHTWLESKGSWVEIGDNGKQFARHFEG